MTLWRWAALVTLPFIAIALSFGRIEGMQACGVAPEPILAFELVASPGEVSALFPDHCRAVHAAAQKQALWLDILAFVQVYSAFLILGLLALRREGAGTRIVRWGIALVLVAALADQWENSRLLAILAHLPGDQGTIDQLYPAPRIKFVLLDLIVALTGWLHFAQGGWRRIAGGTAIIAGLVGAVAILVHPEAGMAAGALGWLALVLASWALALRRSGPTSAQ